MRNSGSFLWFFLLLPKERTSSRETAVPGLAKEYTMRTITVVTATRAEYNQTTRQYIQSARGK